MRIIINRPNKLVSSIHGTYYLGLKESYLTTFGDAIYTAGHSYHDYTTADRPGTIKECSHGSSIGLLTVTLAPAATNDRYSHGADSLIDVVSIDLPELHSLPARNVTIVTSEQ